MSDFKKRVLDAAVEQINLYTDIQAKYEQSKSGRIIVGFEFTFKKSQINIITNKDKDQNTLDMFTGLTEKQINLLAKKLAYDDIFASGYAEVGENYSDLEIRLIKNLNNQEFISKNIHHLERLNLKI